MHTLVPTHSHAQAHTYTYIYSVHCDYMYLYTYLSIYTFVYINLQCTVLTLVVLNYTFHKPSKTAAIFLFKESVEKVVQGCMVVCHSSSIHQLLLPKCCIDLFYFILLFQE